MAGEAQAIVWKDPVIIEALANLKALPNGAETVEDIGIEYLVVSFLASTGFDAESALQRLQETAAWRRTSGASNARAKIIQEGWTHPGDFPHNAEFSQYVPSCQGGKAVDKRGIPYSVRCIGRSDLDGLFQVLSEDDVSTLQLFTQEWRLLSVEAYAKRTGCLGNIVMVQDLYSHEGLWNVWLKNRERASFMKKIAGRIDTHYPGILGSVLLTNAPWAIHAILQFLRPILPQRLMGSIEVIPAARVKERLLEAVDAQSLPSFLGGAGADEDFIKGHNLSTNAFPDGECINVPAGKEDSRGLSLKAGEVAVFGLSVEGAGQDIKFSCVFESADKSVAVETVRDSSRIAQDSAGSTFIAPRDGTFVMVFDNTYSWMNAKTIYFQLFKSEVEPLPVCEPEGTSDIVEESPEGATAKVKESSEGKADIVEASPEATTDRVEESSKRTADVVEESPEGAANNVEES